MRTARHPGFLDLWTYIHAECGISFAEDQLDFLRRRLAGRMRELCLSSYTDYLHLLRSDDRRYEFGLLMDRITTKKSAFFREPEHFTMLSEYTLPQFDSRSPAARPLHIWSAGCATGEEPYSIAILLCERSGPNAMNDVELLATDVSPEAIATARRGIYAAPIVRPLPRVRRECFFERAGEAYRVCKELRGAVRFELCNLHAESWPPLTKAQDLIFCRNVLIYFSQGARRAVAQRLFAALAPGGWLVLGRSESLHDIAPDVQPHYCGPVIAYVKNPIT
jgi:chemotaxis protein methyltransferase CheR